VKDIDFSERALLLDFLTWLLFEGFLPSQDIFDPVQYILDAYEQQEERT
jgi:hypothetical protein